MAGMAGIETIDDKRYIDRKALQRAKLRRLTTPTRKNFIFFVIDVRDANDYDHAQICLDLRVVPSCFEGAGHTALPKYGLPVYKPLASWQSERRLQCRQRRPCSTAFKPGRRR